jgi:hypothetical protein
LSRKNRRLIRIWLIKAFVYFTDNRLRDGEISGRHHRENTLAGNLPGEKLFHFGDIINASIRPGVCKQDQSLIQLDAYTIGNLILPDSPEYPIPATGTPICRDVTPC